MTNAVENITSNFKPDKNLCNFNEDDFYRNKPDQSVIRFVKVILCRNLPKHNYNTEYQHVNKMITAVYNIKFCRFSLEEIVY